MVGSIDTGAQHDHTALVEKYRGNEGGGNFNHNYDWFDPSNVCDGDAPCDSQGHGTHTMGTMAGGTGSNQIGVAPDVEWITAKGCESRGCSAEALLSSAQWMLAPTDLNGENPRPELRPNIVNNSWGADNDGAEDPWFDDVIQAWTASGIFHVFSNGNKGNRGCDTTGSPADSTVAYGVGAYTAENDIWLIDNYGSGRGPGEDGAIKPNVSAPGVNVRSSVPGDGYTGLTGTSMAAPHVAGTAALMWSAGSQLVGDVEATRQILDSTARNMDNDECGGTADDNNVWGEGRVNAYAAVTNSLQDTGTLSGTVTDADTGEPIEGVSVEAVSDEHDGTATTEPNGSYELTLPAGNYEVTVSYFGYERTTATVEVTQGETTTRNFALQPEPTVVLSGQVTDGSGHGWPLYATVSVEGVPGGETYTDPASGRYRFELPANATYTVQVQSEYPGYEREVADVKVGSADAVHNVQLTVDARECAAPGYEHQRDGSLEDFSADGAPEGWTVTDNIGNGQGWRFDDPADRGNQTGGDGGFATVDSHEYGRDGEQDTSLVSPVMDLSGIDNPTVIFSQDYHNFAGSDVADIDVSVDGGETWETARQQTTDLRGPRETLVEIPQAAGESEVQVRFHYYEADWDYWWQVDDVFVGALNCVPTHGGLVFGTVADANTGDGLIGAGVESVDKPAESATTRPTPDDPRLGDGFYWMFSSVTGPHEFEASAAAYTAQTKSRAVATDWATRVDFALEAGKLGIDPGSLEATQQMGESAQRSFTVTNDGGAPAEVEVAERRGDFVIQRPDGEGASLDTMSDQEGAPLQEIEGNFTPRQHAKKAENGAGAGPKKGATTKSGSPHAPPWTDVADHPTSVMDNAVAYHNGKVYSVGGTPDGAGAVAAAYVYDPTSQQWSPIADMPGPRQQPATAFLGGKLYVAGGWGSDGATSSLFVYDPASDSWSQGADLPGPRSAAGTAVLGGKLYVVGGCTTSTCSPEATSVFRYDPAVDNWESLADYPQPVSFQACGAVSGSLYCAGGYAGSSYTSTYAYDPGADSWTQKADLPVDLWAMGYTSANGKLLVSGGVTDGATTITNQGFAYDPVADTWSELPNSNNTLYRGGSACGFYKIGGSSGGFSAEPYGEVLPGYTECGGSGADVPWMSADHTEFTLAPGASRKVTVTLDASVVAQPGEYTASLAIGEDTPYSMDPVTVRMNATPPDTWGKIMGTVSGKSCGGSTGPLEGATVQFDSWARSFTWKTDAQGEYARWVDHRNSPFQLIAAKDGYAPQTRDSSVTAGETTVEDFTLREAFCD